MEENYNRLQSRFNFYVIKRFVELARSLIFKIID